MALKGERCLWPNPEADPDKICFAVQANPFYEGYGSRRPQYGYGNFCIQTICWPTTTTGGRHTVRVLRGATETTVFLWKKDWEGIKIEVMRVLSECKLRGWRLVVRTLSDSEIDIFEDVPNIILFDRDGMEVRLDLSEFLSVESRSDYFVDAYISHNKIFAGTFFGKVFLLDLEDFSLKFSHQNQW